VHGRSGVKILKGWMDIHPSACVTLRPDETHDLDRFCPDALASGRPSDRGGSSPGHPQLHPSDRSSGSSRGRGEGLGGLLRHRCRDTGPRASCRAQADLSTRIQLQLDQGGDLARGRCLRGSSSMARPSGSLRRGPSATWATASVPARWMTLERQLSPPSHGSTACAAGKARVAARSGRSGGSVPASGRCDRAGLNSRRYSTNARRLSHGGDGPAPSSSTSSTLRHGSRVLTGRDPHD